MSTSKNIKIAPQDQDDAIPQDTPPDDDPLLSDLSSLSVEEKAELKRCEGTIKRGLATFYEVGMALSIIREKKLWRAWHRTFNQYCQERWQIGSGRARQLIAASEAASNIQSATVVTPTNERQVRPLMRLAPEQQVEVWRQACGIASGRPVTANHVVAAAHQLYPPHEIRNVVPCTPESVKSHVGTNTVIVWSRLLELACQIKGMGGTKKLRQVLKWPASQSKLAAEEFEGLSADLQEFAAALRGGETKTNAKMDEGIGVFLARQVIGILERIPKDDPQRNHGLAMVADWLGGSNWGAEK